MISLHFSDVSRSSKAVLFLSLVFGVMGDDAEACLVDWCCDGMKMRLFGLGRNFELLILCFIAADCKQTMLLRTRSETDSNFPLKEKCTCKVRTEG